MLWGEKESRGEGITVPVMDGVFLSPRIPVLKSSPQYNGVRRWGLREVIS